MRDVSEGGVGLVHEGPLEPGEYVLRIAVDDSKTVTARVKIVWCRPMTQLFYISGGPLVDVSVDDPTTMLN